MRLTRGASWLPVGLDAGAAAAEQVGEGAVDGGGDQRHGEVLEQVADPEHLVDVEAPRTR